MYRKILSNAMSNGSKFINFDIFEYTNYLHFPYTQLRESKNRDKKCHDTIRSFPWYT